MLANAEPLAFIMHPDAYWASELARAEQARERDPELWALYRAQFHELRAGIPELLTPEQVARIPLATDADRPTPHIVAPREDVALSIVVVTRNDEHVERMAERTQAFIDGVAVAAERAGSKIELIIVEWNPPADRPPLADAYAFPKTHPLLSTTIITVPADVHAQYDLAGKLPLYQMIAKNVGIRRARGRFVLATNIDILLPDALIRHLTAPEREDGILYRSNRWDVRLDVLDRPNAAAMIDAAPALTFRINRRRGATEPGAAAQQDIEATPCASETSSSLEFPPLHTEGCGDFQMLHREDWRRLRGYPELDAFSYHTDSLFEFTCHFAGLDEQVLSDAHPHFHIDHRIGAVITPSAYSTAGRAALAHLSLENIFLLCAIMRERRSFALFNGETWGLASVDPPVAPVTKADWETDPPAYARVDGPLKSARASLSDMPHIPAETLARHVETYAKACAEFLTARRPGAPVRIFGAGGRGRWHAAALERNGITVENFIDNAADGGDMRVDGRSVLPPSTLSFGSGDAPFICVASMYADEICRQLRSLGARDGEDFVALF